MARKIKFPLTMKNGVDVRTIDELQENFDIESVLGYYKDGRLAIWLADRYYTEKADAISNLWADDLELAGKLCEILGVDSSGIDIQSVDIEKIDKNNEKKKILGSVVTEKAILDNIDLIAMSQEELDDILSSNPDCVYLYGETFTVDFDKENVKYIGINAPTVILDHYKPQYENKGISFEKLNMKFDVPKSKGEELYYKEKYDEALPVIRQEAENGNIRSQCILGEMYEYGKGTKRDIKEAIKWYGRSGEQGLAKAQFMLYGIYNFGEDVDYAEALKWCKKAAEQNCLWALRGMSGFYYYGLGVEEDEAEASRWEDKAKEQLNRFIQDSDIIEFGKYQGEPIKWVVLEKFEDKYLVLSLNCLCEKEYEEYEEDTDKDEVTWEECTLRKWLNKDFYRSSFADEEKKNIEYAHIANKDNPEYGTYGGNDTFDNIFLLSIDEYVKYFDKIPPNDAWWWLRSPGRHSDFAADVNYDGAVNAHGDGVSIDYGVRPALYLKF